MHEINRTKKHVAQRQLATAIRLFFGGADDISVVSLAANAWEIIDCFCRVSSVNSLSQQVRENVPQGKRLKLDYINSPYRNFFKHAEYDLDAVLSPIESKFVDGLIFLAVEDYLRWSSQGPVEFQVFQAWYLALYLEKVAESELDRIRAATDAIFPNMRNLTRPEQITLGRDRLEEALSNVELLSDSKTEPLHM
jgi:hypothetical protein